VGVAIVLYLLFIHHLVPAAAASVRHPAHDACHDYFICLVFVIYLLYSACNVRTAAECVRHSAAA
jgi:hypothetical protein